MKKLILLFLLLFIYTMMTNAQEPPLPVLDPREHYTHLWSVSYDYQTNGSLRYLIQDPSNRGGYCAILMAQQDSNSAAGVGRYIYYSYTDDNGDSWTPDVLDSSTSWGFPDMSIRNGLPVISANKTGVVSVFQDALWGAYSFSQLPLVPNYVSSNWAHLSSSSNGNLILAAATNGGTVFGGSYTTFTGTTWSLWNSMPPLGGLSGNYSVESGSNGLVGIFGQNFDGDKSLYWYKSTDNGITFNSREQIFYHVLDGRDTLYPSLVGGFQAVFVGEEPHLVFTVYNTGSAIFPNPHTTAYIKPKILHWSPSTGVTQVAGHFNIGGLADTVTTSLIAPVGQPSISLNLNGILTCCFTVLLKGYTQVVNDEEILNAGEIFQTTSFNNGASWEHPINITNTPGIEEKHPSLINKPVAGWDSVKIYYIRDLKAGGWVSVPEWGKAPVYGIFRILHTISEKEEINQINSQTSSYSLSQNYPNPFNPSTNINYTIITSEYVSLKIYDISGKEVSELVNEKQNAGKYEVSFNGSNLSSGIYFYTLSSGTFKETKSMILIK